MKICPSPTSDTLRTISKIALPSANTHLPVPHRSALAKHSNLHPGNSFGGGKDGANDTYINAHSFCDLLWCIARLNIGVLITLVLDNARYQT